MVSSCGGALWDFHGLSVDFFLSFVMSRICEWMLWRERLRRSSCALCALLGHGMKGFMLTISPSITALTQGWACRFAGSTSVIYAANKTAMEDSVFAGAGPLLA